MSQRGGKAQTAQRAHIELGQLGARARQARRELSARLGRDILQGEVATATGLSQPSVSAIERGTQEPPREVLVRLADYYGVDPGWLAFGALTGAPKVSQQRITESLAALDAARSNGVGVAAPTPAAAPPRPRPGAPRTDRRG